MKILIVEDQKKIASFMRKGLEPAGFVVEVSNHGDEGFTLATTHPCVALVSCIMLPGRDDFSILRNLRARKIAFPVVFLTARSKLSERLAQCIRKKVGGDFLMKLSERIRGVGYRICPEAAWCWAERG